MADIYEIEKYFPSHISDQTLKNYIDHHIKHLIGCYEKELYSSGYYHLHILYMVFTYIQLTRIAKEKKDEFNLCWIGFPDAEKDFLKSSESTFSFSKIKEKSVFRFFRLVDFNDGDIADTSGLINNRNKHLHANGNINCDTKDNFYKEINLYLGKIELVIEKQNNFLEDIYNKIIKDFKKGYKVTKDDIEANFIDPYYFSIFELKYLSKNKENKNSKFIQQYCEDNY